MAIVAPNMPLQNVALKCGDDRKDDQSKSAWLQFLKSVMTFKGDLTALTAPPFLLAPTSIIEYSAYWAEHPRLFVAPALEEDAELRALRVLQWFLSTLREQHSAKDEDGKRKKPKPLNPFLGELFMGKWVDDAGVTELVSEQVSHHPPATAYRIHNKAHGVRLEGHIAPKSYFSTTINIERKGHGVLHLDRYNEDHVITMPPVHVEGIMTFQIAPELSGTSYIRSSSGYTSRIEYASRGWLKGKSNSFAAALFRDGEEKKGRPLYTLEGRWCDAYTVKDARGRTVETVDLTRLRRTPLRVAPLEHQHPLESRRAWRHVADAIRRNDVHACGAEKSRLENAQRALRREERAAGRTWERRFFTETRQDPVLDRLVPRPGGKKDAQPDDEHDRTVWKFDEDKYRQAMAESAADGVKSPTHTRFDSGVGLMDDDAVPA